MTIQILYFAGLRDAMQKDSQTLDVPEGMTIGALTDWLWTQPGCENFKEMPLLKAINEDFAADDERLAPGDCVAFLPPVAGG